MDVRIWRAEPSEREKILELSRLFPGDFLEYVVDDWILREPGGIYLAGAGEQVLACCTLFFPVPGQGWLQGMRVHPSFRRLKVASRLTDFLVTEAQARGAERIGLLTAPGNLAARQLVRRQGFTAFARSRKILFYGSPKENLPVPGPGNWAPAEAADLPEAWSYLQESPVFREAGGYIFHPQYAFVPLTLPYFTAILHKGGVWLLREGNTLEGLLLLDRRTGEDHLCALYLDLPREGLEKAGDLLARFISGDGAEFFSAALLDYQFDFLQDLFTSRLHIEDLEHWLIMERKG